jgi:hypothetical protein
VERLDSYAQTPDGLLLVVDGFSRPQVWDGFTAATTDAGLQPPTAPVALAGSASGNIVGDYYAFERFLDARGNVSDCSPQPARTTVNGAATGSIQDATQDTPIVVTSAGHGLASGARVRITGVQGNSSANGLWTISVIDGDHFALNASYGGDPYTSGGTWQSGAGLITFTGVQVPAEAKVVRRQLLRNTGGQASVFYVDVDTTDLVATTFTSSKDDSTLSAQEGVPLFNDDGSLNANSHGVPPYHKCVIAHHLGRMFMAVERAYDQGNVTVANGSTTVTGLNVDWPAALANRFLYVVGAPRSYQIASVDSATQLTLLEPYGGLSDTFGVYAVRPAPAERRLVYFSEAGQPESWPATNAFSLQEDGDELSGLVAFGSFLYVLERRHVYRFTYQTSPAVDGFVFKSLDRGCLNNRCWVVVDENCFLLDQQGIHSFGSAEASQPLSAQIQQLFQPGGSDLAGKLNWQAADLFHAAHYPSEETIRWFVCLAGERYPRHAVCLAYRAKRWWIEEYRVPVPSSCTGTYQGNRRVFVGSRGRKVLMLAEGWLDGPDPGAGTVRGTVTSATPLTLTDLAASFPAAGVVGNPVVLAEGRGQGQARTVLEVDGPTLVLDRPWSVLPDGTTTYQLGGVPWTWRSQWWPYAEGETNVSTRVALAFRPAASPSPAGLRLFNDWTEDPIPQATTRTPSFAEGMGSSADGTRLTIDLSKQHGNAQQRMDRHKERNVLAASRLSIELSGVVNDDPVRIYEVVLDGLETE